MKVDAPCRGHARPRLTALGACLLVALVPCLAHAEERSPTRGDDATPAKPTDTPAIPSPDGHASEAGAATDAAGGPTTEPGEEPAPIDLVYDDARTAEDLAREHSPVDVTILSGQRGKRITGAAFRVGKEELERYEDDNVHRTLARVPGVYVRDEDGYGLRPNIGMRGASSDRSKKITLMEDGILLAPAPYSAPAAYYFPLSTRLTGIEVYKGPSALRYGPNSIGGAVNLVTRAIPMGHRVGTDVAAGSQRYLKEHLHYGYGTRHAGAVFEAVHLRSDGFKVQEGAAPRLRANTGFDKLELMAKARVNTDPDARIYHELRGKVGYSFERSNETYLGLTNDDFRADPLRRYAASALDQMSYHRTIASVTYALVVRDRLQLSTTLYRHDLARAWFKLNRFAGKELPDILANPTTGENALYYAILTGQQDSVSPDQTLRFGTNDRVFVSQGLQTTGEWTLPRIGKVEQKVQFGFRVHHDSVRRLHTEDGYRMQATATGGRLVRDASPRATNADDLDSALALSAHLVDEIVAFGVVLTPGVRTELIDTQRADRLTGVITRGTQRVLLPGVGALWAANDTFSLLGGVHQGFSPVSPGQSPEVKPEVAVNYELGARASHRLVQAEVVGFYSDYSNLTGQCTFPSGCPESQLDQQFGGGRAQVAGVEAAASSEPSAPFGLTFPVRAAYTFTKTRFASSFTSENPQWGSVAEGDELPFVPQHQLSVNAGADWQKRLALHVGVTAMGAMRERAGQGEPEPGYRTDAFAVLDATASYRVRPELQIYAKCENLLDNAYLVSHQPFGARPGQPRFAYLGVKVELDRP